ncbi:MAG: PEP-CTERM sorting domain-containing protein [Roseibacillus sp.]
MKKKLRTQLLVTTTFVAVLTASQAHAAVTVLATTQVATVLDDNANNWSNGTVNVVGSPSPGNNELRTFVGFSTFDLSGFTPAELESASFTIGFDLAVLAGAPTGLSIEYIGTYANDNVRGADTGGANLAQWISDPTVDTVVSGYSTAGAASEAIALSDGSFADGDFAVFRYVYDAGASLASNDQWGITNATLTVDTIPEPSSFLLLGIGLAFGSIRRRC